MNGIDTVVDQALRPSFYGGVTKPQRPVEARLNVIRALIGERPGLPVREIAAETGITLRQTWNAVVDGERRGVLVCKKQPDPNINNVVCKFVYLGEH